MIEDEQDPIWFHTVAINPNDVVHPDPPGQINETFVRLARHVKWHLTDGANRAYCCGIRLQCCLRTLVPIPSCPLRMPQSPNPNFGVYGIRRLANDGWPTQENRIGRRVLFHLVKPAGNALLGPSPKSLQLSTLRHRRARCLHSPFAGLRLSSPSRSPHGGLAAHQTQSPRSTPVFIKHRQAPAKRGACSTW